MANDNKKEISGKDLISASGNAPLQETVNAPLNLDGSQDAPKINSKGKEVSSKITAND